MDQGDKSMHFSCDQKANFQTLRKIIIRWLGDWHGYCRTISRALVGCFAIYGVSHDIFITFRMLLRHNPFTIGRFCGPRIFDRTLVVHDTYY